MYSDLFPARLPPKLADLDPPLTKVGVRGSPGVDDAQALLALTLRRDGVTGRVLDLQAMSGLVARACPDAEVTGVERSAAALAALRASGVAALGGVVGADVGRAPTVTLVLSGDRGNDFVDASLAWAANCTEAGGTLYLAGDKQKGFERYLKRAGAAFGSAEVVARDGGMRVGRLRSRNDAPLPVPETRTYELDGLRVVGLPGVFSASALDRASNLLLAHLGDVRGRRVLDLGCGAGVLGAVCLSRGAATATLLDDDLMAVESARRTLDASSLVGGEVRHSDVGSALTSGETFDLVVSNPPFHVGRRVVLDVAAEFIRVAGERLESGGEMRLVANDFLPYEDLLGRWGRVEALAREGGFKVLRARRTEGAGKS